MSKSGAFISYARVDGESFAASLRTRLVADAPDIKVWQDRPEIEGGVGWWRQIEEALEKVEFLVIVMTPGVLASEMTRKEWRTARQSGVCVFPVKGPGFSFNDPRLPGWMSRVHIYDLDVQWEVFTAHLRRGCQATRIPFMAPPLPAGYVRREIEANQLHSLVIDERTGDTLAPTVMLAGTGGFGKTTLASALCHDDDVVTSFDNGVLWATLGQSPNIQGELTRLYAALTGDRPGFVSVEDAAQAFAEKLEHKRCLIVVDDVWEVAHLRPFLRGGPNCARVVTTRLEQVAAEGVRVEVHALTSQEAVSLLVSRLPSVPDDVEPFRRLSQRLGEWPLLLRLAGGALRQRLGRGDTLAGALRYVERSLLKHGVTAFDRQNAVDRHEAVASTLGMSMDLLQDVDRSRCAQLAIFPEDIPIPAAVIGELWGLDDHDAEEVLSRLDDASLIEFDLGKGTVSIHDVMREFFATLLGHDATALAHAQLVDAWADLRDLPHRYAWRWLGHHLVLAGRRERLHELLVDLDWLQRKLQAADIYALAEDFRFFPDDVQLPLLHKALLLSSHVLAKDKSQLLTQVLGRLPNPERFFGDSLDSCISAYEFNWIRPVVASLVGPGGALIRMLESSGVPDWVAVTPDGRWIVSSTDEGALAVWELESGTLARTWRQVTLDKPSPFQPVERSGLTCSMMADGRVLLGGTHDLSVWDPTNDAEPRPIVKVQDGVRSLAVSKDCRTALVGSRKGGLTLYSLENGSCLAQLVSQRIDIETGETISQGVAHRLGIAAVAISADGRLGLSGSYDKTLRIWDLESHSLIDTLYPPHAGIVYGVSTASGTPVAASAGGDHVIRIWNLETQTCCGTLTGHEGRVLDVALSSDGSRVLSGSRDRSIKLWDVASGATRVTLRGHSDSVVSVALPPDGKTAVSAAMDGTIRVWKLEAGDARASTQEHEGWIQAVAMAPNGEFAITGGQDHRLRVWNPATASVRCVLTGHHDAVGSIAIHSDRGIVVSGSYDRQVIVWDLATERPLHVLEGQGDAMNAVVISPDGSRAMTASKDGDVFVWNIERGRLLRRWVAHRRELTFLAPFPDWRTVLTGSMDGNIAVWDLATTSCVNVFPAHVGGVTSGAVMPGGDLFISGGLDGILKLWSLPQCKLLREVQGHASRVRSLSCSQNGKLVISTSYDRYLKAFTVPTLEPLASFTADSAIAAAAVSEKGDLIVAGDAQGCTHFLQLIAGP